MSKWRYVLVCSVVLMASAAAAQSGRRAGYDVDFIGPPLADPVMQYNKESYVTYGCAYCHGVDLVPRGEAPDLRQSAVVGSDLDGTAIVRVLRAGIPKTSKLSPMPQYLGCERPAVERHCGVDSLCAKARSSYQPHSSRPATGECDRRTNILRAAVQFLSLAIRGPRGARQEYDSTRLRAQILEPSALEGDGSFKVDALQNSRIAEGRRRHHALLENYSAGQVADLLAFVQGLN